MTRRQLSVEFRPLDLGRNVPKQPANDFGARYAEDCLRRAIEGGDAPVTIKRKETLAHPFKERLNERVLDPSCPLPSLFEHPTRRHPPHRYVTTIP